MAPGILFSPFQKGQIYALHKHAHWPLQRIADLMDTSKPAISQAIYRMERAPQTPQRRGRRPVITTQKRRRLIDRICANAQSRRLRLDQIAELEHIHYHLMTIRKALKKEGYQRYIAKRKPFLTQAYKEARLRWAQEHVDWSDRQWARVIWTDEASIACGYFGQVYVTRRSDEAFHEDCLTARFRNYSACMIWGCISAEGVHALHVFEKGSVNAEVFCKQVLPVLQHAVQRQRDGSVFQQEPLIVLDNSSVHTAATTRAGFMQYGIQVLEWPPCSPDLNPMENIWSILKERVGKHFPTTRAAVIQAIQEEWAKLSVSDLARVCQSMRQRCQAVIDAKGGHTRW